MNPADVMRLPVGLLDEMNQVIRDENRARRLAERRTSARTKARRH